MRGIGREGKERTELGPLGEGRPVEVSECMVCDGFSGAGRGGGEEGWMCSLAVHAPLGGRTEGALPS